MRSRALLRVPLRLLGLAVFLGGLLVAALAVDALSALKRRCL